MQQYTGLEPGSKIGPFRIVAKIAEGGMGEIYQGVDDELNRRVAVKILLPSALREADGLGRFKGEARALAQIEHPNVVRIIMAGEEQGLHYMVLDYIDGLQLDQYLAKHSPSLTEVLDLFMQMCRGLLAAHELEIVHRDIKPQNIMITNKGRVKLVDFGVAKAQTDHDNFKTTVGVVVGTRSFLAPEILRGAPATKQGDIYALGLILKYMLTGDMPTAAPISDGVNRMPTTKYNLLVPNALTHALTGMTQAAANIRYTDLKDVLKDLNLVSLKQIHADLLVSIPGKAPVANLEQLMATCRERGLDAVDARMAINLAAKPAAAKPPADNGKTQVMVLNAPQEFQVSDEALTRAIARVRQTKGIVISGGMRTPAAAQAHAKAQDPISIAPVSGGGGYQSQASGDVPYLKIGFAVIVTVLLLRMFFYGPKSGDGKSVFQSVTSGIESITGGGSRSPASGN